MYIYEFSLTHINLITSAKDQRRRRERVNALFQTCFFTCSLTARLAIFGTYIDESLYVSLLEVEEDGRVVEVGQVGHVLAAVILRRVHLRKMWSTSAKKRRLSSEYWTQISRL